MMSSLPLQPTKKKSALWPTAQPCNADGENAGYQQGMMINNASG
jgi:hypothetical protein